MLQHQDLLDKDSIIIGTYKRIVVTVYTDDNKTEVDQNLAGNPIVWNLQGAMGNMITKTSDDGGISVDDPDVGDIAIEILEDDSVGLSPGYYTHIAELTSSGRKRPLFDGDVFVKNN